MNPLGDHLSRFDYIAIPLHRGPTGHLQIDGALNGVEASLYLDTGAGRTVLDLDQARRRGLVLTEGPRTAGGLGTENMIAHQTIVRHFTLPGMEETDFAVAVVDLSHVNKGLRARGARPMDGIIGADVLESREAIIDYKHLQLYLKSTGSRRAA
jgi:hypothetical protein